MELIINLFAQLDWAFLAQANIDGMVESGLSNMLKYGLLLCCGAIILAGFMIIRGQIEYAMYALIGGLTIGAAAFISKAIFALFESL